MSTRKITKKVRVIELNDKIFKYTHTSATPITISRKFIYSF